MALTNYHRNKLIDYWYRGETYTPPGSLYVALLTAASTSTHTELTSGGVARVTVARSLSAWAGTQSDGSTTASSGTTGITSNNAAITFAASASASVSASYIGIFDASSSGNLLEFFPIRNSAGDAITRTWQIGDAVSIAISQLRITWA